MLKAEINAILNFAEDDEFLFCFSPPQPCKKISTALDYALRDVAFYVIRRGTGTITHRSCYVWNSRVAACFTVRRNGSDAPVLWSRLVYGRRLKDSAAHLIALNHLHTRLDGTFVTEQVVGSGRR